MFVLTTKHTAVDRGIAAVVAVAMVCWAVGAHYTAQAAGLVDTSDVLSTSEPSTNANHTITFDLPSTSSGIDEDDIIRITMPAGFTIPALASEDFDLTVNAAEEDLTADWSASSSGQIIELTSTGGIATADDTLEIEIGDHADQDGTGDTQIQNNAAVGSYEMTIEIVDEGTTVQDSGATVLAITDTVLVTADVDPIFIFQVGGIASSTAIDTETTDVDTSTTTIPFGTLAPGTAKVAAQQLNVTTNAASGYSVTVMTDQQLTADNGADIDSFIDGADTAAPTAWASPTGTINTEDTYGHWGMRSSDSDLGTNYADGEYTAVQTSATEIMSHTGPSDGSTDDEGITQVMYKAEIMSYQEAADDYTATLTYVATPTF